MKRLLEHAAVTAVAFGYPWLGISFARMDFAWHLSVSDADRGMYVFCASVMAAAVNCMLGMYRA